MWCVGLGGRRTPDGVRCSAGESAVVGLVVERHKCGVDRGGHGATVRELTTGHAAHPADFPTRHGRADRDAAALIREPVKQLAETPEVLQRVFHAAKDSGVVEARYLRVKNWRDHQHYANREPPWIKLHRKLLKDDSFGRFEEWEQWQLVRIWMIATDSSRFTADEKGRPCPVVADDERTLRRAIGSLRKVALAKFIREGWLIPVAEDELLAPGEHDASAGASTLLDAEKGRGREAEKSVSSGSGVARFAPPRKLPSNEDKEVTIGKLLTFIGSHADEGTEGVVRGFAKKLPPSSLAKVAESVAAGKTKTDRASHAVGALKKELEEHTPAPDQRSAA